MPDKVIEFKTDGDLEKWANGTDKVAADLAKRVQDVELALQESDPDGNFKKINAEMVKLKDHVAKVGSSLATRGDGVNRLPIGKADFESGGFKALYGNRKTETNIDRNGQMQEPEGPIARWQKAGDDLQIAVALESAIAGHPIQTRKTKFYEERFKPAHDEMTDYLKAAIDTAAGDPGAGNWIPTGMSPQIDRLIEIDLRLLLMIRREKLVRSPFLFPVQTGRSTFTRKSEEAVEVQGTRTAGIAGDAAGTNALHDNVQFDRRRLAGVFTITEDAANDSLPPLIAFARSEMAQSLARHREDAFVNGGTGTHIDTDIEALGAEDHRKLYQGLRTFGLANTGARVDVSGVRIDDNVAWGASVRTAIGNMAGDYGAVQSYGGVPDDIVIETSMNVFNQILEIPEFRHLNTFGAQATITGVNANTGFRPDGSWLIVSEFSRNDLNAAGIDDGITADFMEMTVFNRKAWMEGEFQAPRVQVFTDSYFKLWGQMGIMLDWAGEVNAIKDETAATQNHTLTVFNIAK